MSTQPDWYLAGEYFETCNCHTVCPCIWLEPPSEGNCKLLVGWHIAKGYLEKTSLADLNVALACYAPGNMIDGNWEAVLYLDQRVTPEQWLALEKIFSGQVGGHLALLMGFVDKVLGIHLAKIDYELEERSRRLNVEGVACAEVRGIEGIRGGVSIVDNPPLCVVPSHPSSVARSQKLSYHDRHFQWEFSDRNGFYSPFVYHP